MSDINTELAATESEAVEQVNAEIQAAYEQIGQMITSGVPGVVEHHGDNKDVMLQTLYLHQQLIKGLKLAEDLITEKIIEQQFIPYGGEQVELGGEQKFIEVHRTGDKKRTDNPMIASLVQKRLTVDCAVDDETGEVDERASKAVAKAVDTMVKLTGANTESFNGWRKRVAKSLDIDVNKYETREGGRLVVTIK